jgi:hypothetical protein
MKTPLLVSSALAAWLLALPAWGSATYPAEVQNYYGISTLPASGLGCTLCHRNDVGGATTIITPFGRALLRQGAIGNNIPSLLAALKANEQAAIDSDADGAPDAAELRGGENPNVGNGEAGPTGPQAPLPETGCSVARRGERAACFDWRALGGLAALTVLRRRRRHPHLRR